MLRIVLAVHDHFFGRLRNHISHKVDRIPGHIVTHRSRNRKHHRTYFGAESDIGQRDDSDLKRRSVLDDIGNTPYTLYLEGYLSVAKIVHSFRTGIACPGLLSVRTEYVLIKIDGRSRLVVIDRDRCSVLAYEFGSEPVDELVHHPGDIVAFGSHKTDTLSGCLAFDGLHCENQRI